MSRRSKIAFSKLGGTKVVAVALAGAWLLAACGDDGGTTDTGGSETTASESAASETSASEGAADSSAIADRLDAIQVAIDDWAGAETIEEAHVAAETAHNLVSGTETLGAGDRDGDGTVGGDVDAGLLPAQDGSTGLVADLPEECDLVDVLGGDWSDPEQRWETVQTAIEEWAPTNNTFPDLPSHPQRIVGWATLTLRSDDLDEAHEYSGHAQLHLDVARDAIEAC